MNQLNDSTELKTLLPASLEFSFILLKECSNYCTIALISHASKVMLKMLQARLQQYVNHEIPDVQAGCRKGWGSPALAPATHPGPKQEAWVC